jgi:hypothetical protein
MDTHAIAKTSISKKDFNAVLSMHFASRPISNKRKVIVNANNGKSDAVFTIPASPVCVPEEGISIGLITGYSVTRFSTGVLSFEVGEARFFGIVAESGFTKAECGYIQFFEAVFSCSVSTGTTTAVESVAVSSVFFVEQLS